jgi:hypothetical protein
LNEIYIFSNKLSRAKIENEISKWILLDNSSYDEYPGISGGFWGHDLIIAPKCLGGENGSDSYAL